MRYIIPLLVLILLFAAHPAAVAQQPATAGSAAENVFTSKTHGVSIVFPAGWTVKETPAGNVQALEPLRPETNAFRLNIQVMFVKKPTPAYSIKYDMDQIRTLVKDYVQIGRGTKQIGGTTFHWVDFLYMDGDRQIHNLNHVGEIGGTIVTIAAVTPAQVFPAIASNAVATAESLRIITKDK